VAAALTGAGALAAETRRVRGVSGAFSGQGQIFAVVQRSRGVSAALMATGILFADGRVPTRGVKAIGRALRAYKASPSITRRINLNPTVEGR
jgi:hypothetical protein